MYWLRRFWVKACTSRTASQTRQGWSDSPRINLNLLVLGDVSYLLWRTVGWRGRCRVLKFIFLAGKSSLIAISFKSLQASPKWGGKEVHWGLCRHIHVLGAAKGMQIPVLLLPTLCRLGGKHQGPGQVCAGHHDTWETKGPRCSSASLGAGLQGKGTSWAPSTSPVWTASHMLWSLGGKVWLILAFFQLHSLPIN